MLQVIVSARKPDFFQKSNPLYEIVTEEGLMRPCFKATSGAILSSPLSIHNMDAIAGVRNNYSLVYVKV